MSWMAVNKESLFSNEYEWYVLFVTTGYEYRVRDALYRSLEKKNMEKAEINFFVPQLEEYVRRNRVWEIQKKTLFPGYLFIYGLLTPELYHFIKTSPNIIRFLKDDVNILTIPKNEVSLLGDFMNEEMIVGLSKVTFDEGDNIIVLSGPLKGLEGSICKINKHHRRVTVSIDFMGRTTKVELAIDMIQQMKFM